MQKIRVGVLMGGKNREREVSFNSGRTICDHLDTTCFDIIPLFQTVQSFLYILPWQFLYRGKINDFEHRLITDAQLIAWDKLYRYVDLVYIAQHGRYSEDGALQGLLEVLGIAYHGSRVCASAIGMDKIMQKVFLRAAGITVPREIVIRPSEKNFTTQVLVERMQAVDLTFPCIVKPQKEGSSFGVTLVKKEEDLVPAIMHAMYINDDVAQSVLIEEKIEGMEFSCILITDPTTEQLIVLPPTEIIQKSPDSIFDYEQKYMPGRSLQRTPARCDTRQLTDIQQTALKTAEILDFRTIARIDGFLVPSGKIIVTDPNSFSGAAPSSFMFKQAAEYGMNHTQFINHIITTEIRSYGMQERLQMLEKNVLDNKKKIRIAVLMGGKSNEREISLESGRNVTYKLSPYKYNVVPLFVDQHLKLHRLDSRMLVCNSTAEIADYCSDKTMLLWQDLKSEVDFVFNALHGGQGENGCVQGLLEVLGLPYNGSSISTSALCMDKYKTNLFLQGHGFTVPRNIFIKKDVWDNNKITIIDAIKDQLHVPCIIKPSDDGCSTFVSKVETHDELIQTIQDLFDHGKQTVLAEELLNGMELTGGVIGNDHAYALPPSQAIAQEKVLSIEEKFLPGAGENQTPAPLPLEALNLIKKTLEKVYLAVEAKGYARIDFFFQAAHENPTGKDRVVILEINTLPALTPATCLFHQVGEIGLKPMDFIDLIVHLGLKAHTSHEIDRSIISTATIPQQLIDCCLL